MGRNENKIKVREATRKGGTRSLDPPAAATFKPTSFLSARGPLDALYHWGMGGMIDFLAIILGIGTISPFSLPLPASYLNLTFSTLLLPPVLIILFLLGVVWEDWNVGNARFIFPYEPIPIVMAKEEMLQLQTR